MSSKDSKGYSIRTAVYKGNTLVNICDEELIGRTVREGNLTMHISRDYFYGEIVDERQALDLIKKCPIISLAGERSVSLAIKNNIGSKDAIRVIEGVPFLMIYKFLR